MFASCIVYTMYHNYCTIYQVNISWEKYHNSLMHRYSPTIYNLFNYHGALLTALLVISVGRENVLFS